MIELIAQRGYPAVRILDLTQLAHVSPPTLYSLYADKEELLLGAYEDIAGRTRTRVGEARAAGDTPEESLRRAMRAFAEIGGGRAGGDDAARCSAPSAPGHVRSSGATARPRRWSNWSASGACSAVERATA